MNKILIILFCLGLILPLSAQKELLQSGPMVAYSTMKEVKIVVQTTETAKVHIEYWDFTQKENKYKTDPIFSDKTDAFVVHLIADQLEPGIKYEYSLFINDELVVRPYRLEFESQPLWLWRHDAPDFSFATGSCAYINEPVYDRPGTPYGSNYQIFEDIYRKDPAFMLWLGDNLYLREADWNSETGILHRYTHTRSNPEMQAMFGSMHHYGIWDDHDFGPNNSDRSFAKKKSTERIFKLFFPAMNYVFDEGITGFFQWADCEFFLLDNRYWRTPNKRSDIEEHQIIGDAQIEWLLDALVNSYAPFKFVVVGGQFLSTIKAHERHINYAPAERDKLIQSIEKLKIGGVIFITGDVHHTELSKLDLEAGYPIYDLTVSPLTSGVAGRGAEANELQVPGTLVKKHNYAKMDVYGSRKDRTLKISIFDSNGTEQWNQIIRADELKYKKPEAE